MSLSNATIAHWIGDIVEYVYQLSEKLRDNLFLNQLDKVTGEYKMVLV